MGGMNALEIDWTQCELIERIPGTVSGRPIVRGKLDDIHEDYAGLSIPQIQRLIEFAHLQRGADCSVKVLLDENLPHGCDKGSVVMRLSPSAIWIGQD